MSKLETNTIDTVSGTTNLVIGSTNTSSITLGASGDTITVPNGALTGQNYPSFLAYRSGNQSITDNTLTKVEFNSVDYDTDSCYDNTTNYRFTPTVAGKYFVYATIRGDSNGDSNIQFHSIQIYKNGSAISYASQNFQANYPRIMNIPISFVVDMNGSTDYLEIFYNMNDISGNPFITEGNKASNFGAYRIGS